MNPDLKVDPHATLFVTDAEMIRRMGVPEKTAREAIRVLDANRGSGFPRKQAMWGNRRHWPSVLAYLERTGGIKLDAPQPKERAYAR